MTDTTRGSLVLWYAEQVNRVLDENDRLRREVADREARIAELIPNPMCEPEES